VALALPACGSGDLGPATEPGQPAVVTITSGSGQSGPAGRPTAGNLFDLHRGGGLTPTTAVTRESGEATAIWTLGTQAGPMTASATVHGLAPADFAATAVAGAPARLSFVAAPRAAVAGRAFDPPVAVVLEDEYGNRVPGGPSQVNLALNTGRLAGQTSVGAVEGLAAFPGLHIDSAGLGYVLIAVAEGLTAAESPAFPVASDVVAASRSRLTASPATVRTGEASIVTVTARDAFGNPVAGAPVEIGASGSGNSIAQPSATVRAVARADPSARVAPAGRASPLASAG
jgi:adhesin/invasin